MIVTVFVSIFLSVIWFHCHCHKNEKCICLWWDNERDFIVYCVSANKLI